MSDVEHALEDVKGRDPFLTLVLGLLLPGAGHLYIGKKLKAIIFSVAINATILTGLWMGAWKAIFIGRWAFFAQWGGGLLSLLAAAMAKRSGVTGIDNTNFIPLLDVGTLYTASAGLLNMIIALNAMLLAHNASKEINGEVGQ